MMNQREVLQLARGVLLGGVLAVLALFSGAVALVYVTGGLEGSVFHLTFALAVYAVSTFGAVWATGFWGRWGMLVFFALAPIVIVVDFSINPLFPAGVVLFAGGCYAVVHLKANDD